MTPPKLEAVLVDVEDCIAVVKFNRPNNANALGIHGPCSTTAYRLILLQGIRP